MTLREERRLAVFEFNSASIVRSIPLTSGDALVAAGSKALVIAYPEKRLIERWDLAKMTQAGPIVPSPIRGRLLSVAMGHDSEGPLLAAWLPNVIEDAHAKEPPRFSFLDPATLGVLKTGSISSGGVRGFAALSTSGGSFTLQPFNEEWVHVRASAGGDLFTAWQSNGGSGGIETLSIRGEKVASNHVQQGQNHLAPGPDGWTVFTGSGARLDSSGRIREGFQGREHSPRVLAVPSPEPGYYLTVDGHFSDPLLSDQSVTATIRDDLEGTPLVIVRDLTELAETARREGVLKDDFSFEKRVHFVPTAKLLVTIPASGDRLVLRRVDLDQLLARNAEDWLVVTSPRLLGAEAGKPLRHQVQVRVGRGKPRFSLGNGPAGLTIDADGMISWPSPSQAPDADESVLAVNVLDAANRIHAVPIRIQVR